MIDALLTGTIVLVAAVFIFYYFKGDGPREAETPASSCGSGCGGTCGDGGLEV